MGYYSYFTLTAEDAEGRSMTDDAALLDAVIRISGYTEGRWWDSDGDEIRSAQEMKWYDHQEHLATISKAFPLYRFTLFVEGEDGAQAYLYARAGAVERCDGVMTFPDRTIW